MPTDARAILQAFKAQLEEAESELAQGNILIKTMREAGDDVTQVEQNQRTLVAKIAAYKKAIDNNLR